MASSKAYAKYMTRHRLPNPAAAALLVVDMQNHFASIAAPILAPLTKTIALARALKIPTIFTQHVDNHSPRNMLREFWPDEPDFIAAGSPAAALIDGLGFDPETDKLVVKSTYSSFYGTDLEGILGDLGVEEVIVVGVMTNLCCETAAREAFVRGFRVFFSADATGTVSDEMQLATLGNLGFGFAYIVDFEGLEKMRTTV